MPNKKPPRGPRSPEITDQIVEQSGQTLDYLSLHLTAWPQVQAAADGLCVLLQLYPTARALAGSLPAAGRRPAGDCRT